ncbi:hypothetical protein LCGC14_0454110 [marine sediment metagenome]|uniref:Uncharacterized protein n=1 Tax=marine sediment metagenome TaxID=412755 RepID=A0A0F9V3T9_9ZZZZ
MKELNEEELFMIEPQNGQKVVSKSIKDIENLIDSWDNSLLLKSILNKATTYKISRVFSLDP